MSVADAEPAHKQVNASIATPLGLRHPSIIKREPLL
jgi:hypothetical protein